MKIKKLSLILGLILSLFLCSCYSLKDEVKVKSYQLSANKIATSDENINIRETPKDKYEKIHKKIYKSGDSGDRIKDLQERLNEFGYTVEIDGKYGESTYFAVMDLQERNKLQADGIIADDTTKLLYSSPNEKNLYKSKLEPEVNAEVVANKAQGEALINSQDCPSFTNYYIIANLSEKRVYIFNGSNRNWILINTFQCSPGDASTPTITGHFDVGAKGQAFVTPNDVVCKYYTQISGNYLFHSILYDKEGNIVDGTLGASISHGCVRLQIQNAKYIYDKIPVGSSIWIQ